ncbi:hypothetical protein ACUSIJ_24740 [Pseudochelatococcus sp. B33]
MNFFSWLSNDSDNRKVIDARDLMIDDLERENNSLAAEVHELREKLKKAAAAIASARASLTDWSA